MVPTSTIRVIIWVASFVTAGAAFGMDWAIQSVEVPLWALLVLTFIPTSDLIDVVQDIIDAVSSKVTVEEGKRQ